MPAFYNVHDVLSVLPTSVTRVRRRMFGLLLVGSAILHFAIVLAVPRAVKYDESAYLLLGRNFLAGHGLTMGYANHPELPHPPLYPVVVGIVNLALKNLEVASDVAC